MTNTNLCPHTVTYVLSTDAASSSTLILASNADEAIAQLHVMFPGAVIYVINVREGY